MSDAALTLSLLLIEDDEASLMRREAERLADEITQEVMVRLAAVLHLLPPPETE